MGSIWAEAGEEPVVLEPVAFFNGSALDYLQAIYQGRIEPDFTRMRAASIALAYESPKLQATAVVRFDLDFSAKLDRAVRRSDKHRLIPNALLERPAKVSETPSAFRRRF
jgi:hypothetical protein